MAVVDLKVFATKKLIHAYENFGGLDGGCFWWEEAEVRRGNVDHTFVFAVAVVFGLARSRDRCFDVRVELGVIVDFEPEINILGCATCAVVTMLCVELKASWINNNRVGVGRCTCLGSGAILEASCAKDAKWLGRDVAKKFDKVVVFVSRNRLHGLHVTG